MKTKIIKIILSTLLILSVIAFCYLFIKNYLIEKELKELNKEKIVLNNNYNEIMDNKTKLEKELNDIKDKTKEKISEYEVWKETNKKIKEIIG